MCVRLDACILWRCNRAWLDVAAVNVVVDIEAATAASLCALTNEDAALARQQRRTFNDVSEEHLNRLG